MRIRKVVAYITRVGVGGGLELLVFEHRDFPDAGVQVPAGTVEEGEGIGEALLREIEEETGLPGCRVVRELAVYDWEHPETHNVHERHVFHLEAPEGVGEEWSWVETSGGAVSEDQGFVFLFRWVALDGEIDLIAGFGDYLYLIK